MMDEMKGSASAKESVGAQCSLQELHWKDFLIHLLGSAAKCCIKQLIHYLSSNMLYRTYRSQALCLVKVPDTHVFFKNTAAVVVTQQLLTVI